MWNLLILCLSCICLSSCVSVPFITKCVWDDSKCLKDNMARAIPLFADGIPELNVQPMDPLKIKRIDATNNNIKLIVTNVTVAGNRGCEPIDVKRDKANSKLTIKMACPNKLEGTYEMNGNLLFLPITGNGPAHVNIRKIMVTVEVDLETYEKEKKKHWKIKSWRHSFELKEKSDVEFENLFPGNDFLRKTTNELIANNGNDVIMEIGPLIVKAVLAKVVKNVESFFSAVPLEDLVLDSFHIEFQSKNCIYVLGSLKGKSQACT